MKNADIFIFDEPDAALDILNQRELIETFSKLLFEKIGIFVSHQIKHVNMLANDIFVMDEGRIIERGKHEELINLKGLYYEMYSQSNEINNLEEVKNIVDSFTYVD